MPEDCRPPEETQRPRSPWGQATFSAEDFEGDDDEDEEDDDEAVLLSPDEDDEEDDLSLLPGFSPLPDFSPPDEEDEESEDPAAVEVDAGSEAVDPLRLSVR
jgi:hypothetical protein